MNRISHTPPPQPRQPFHAQTLRGPDPEPVLPLPPQHARAQEPRGEVLAEPREEVWAQRARLGAAVLEGAQDADEMRQAGQEDEDVEDLVAGADEVEAAGLEALGDLFWKAPLVR